MGAPRRRGSTKRHRYTAAGVILLFAAGSPAADVSEPADATARALYTVCRMQPRVESTAALVRAGLAAQRGQLPAESLDRLEARVGKAYAPATLAASTLENLGHSTGAPRLAAALDWCESALGRRFLTAEAEASGIDAALAIQDFARGFDTTPPDRARMVLESRFESATKSTEFRVALAAATSLAITLAFDAELPEAERAGQDAIRTGVAATSPEMAEVLRPVSAIEFLYTYRNFSADEIVQYIAFLESDVGRWSLQTRNGAYLAAMQRSAESLAADR